MNQAHKLNEPWARDREAVEAGMEMLRWELSGPDAATMVHRVRREGADVWLIVIVLMVAWVGAGLVIFNYVIDSASSWTIFLTSIAVGLAVLGIIGGYRHVRPDPVRQGQSISSGSLVFTSTGVIVGEHARLWHASDYKLRAVSLASQPRMQLVVDFGSRGAFEIPVPAQLEQDVEEMTQMLRARTSALKAEMLPADAPKPKRSGTDE